MKWIIKWLSHILLLKDFNLLGKACVLIVFGSSLGSKGFDTLLLFSMFLFLFSFRAYVCFYNFTEKEAIEENKRRREHEKQKEIESAMALSVTPMEIEFRDEKLTGILSNKDGIEISITIEKTSCGYLGLVKSPSWSKGHTYINRGYLKELANGLIAMDVKLTEIEESSQDEV